MIRLLVVTAIDVEARGLARRLGLVRVAGAPGLHHRAPGFDLACAGPRARHLGRLAHLAPGAALIVSAGTCGALAPDLAEGDLVVPDRVVAGRGTPLTLPGAPGLSQAGTLVSVDEVLESAPAKAQLAQASAALAVDMESAAIVTWARALGIPAVVVRAVSESAERGVPAALAAVVDDQGTTRPARVARALVTRPGTIVHALRLRRSTSAALRSVAAALRTLGEAMASAGPASSGQTPSGGPRAEPRTSAGAPR